MFRKIFIANRGEIAIRVARACRQLGLSSVAAYSDADRDAEHVGAADEAVRIGPAEARLSYLDIEAIVSAATDCGADALHPGYGFLAENGDLAEACAEQGITFIGPPAGVLRMLGDKLQARTTMQAAGVPVVPGTFEAIADPEVLRAAADEIGFPVLLKAAGGGGGTGMRRVEDETGLQAALAEAAAEAESAFDNAAVYVEKLIEPVRHVEVQILADTHGSVIALGERECSLQRRHQKVIEESPSPAVGEALRQQLCDAARRAAAAAGYVGAGTVEFLLGRGGAFHFLEVNARIQVEHPVTEERFGLDLVAWQMRVAAGEALPDEFGEPRGWAMEARVYAEDPATGFLPSAGRIHALHLPTGPGIRVDGGVRRGSAVPMEYDPILAKVIAWGPDRETCRRRLTAALRETVVLGVASNVAFLADCLEHPAFVRGDTDTQLLERSLVPERAEPDEDDIAVALLGAALALEGSVGGDPAHPGERSASPVVVPGPWERLRGRLFPDGAEG